MKNLLKTTLVVSALAIVFCSASLYAQPATYVPLEPSLPLNPGGAYPTTIDTYLPAAFRFALGIAGVLAFIMITFGGIKYATTDAISGKAEGRENIENAIWGLLVVLGAWAILNTINPQILSFNLLIKSPNLTNVVPGTTSKILPWYPLSAADVALNNSMKADLQNNYQVTTNSGPCTTPNIVTGCTNLVGLPNAAYVGVATLKSSCGSGCAVNITGGTEGGHETHGPNIPTLDLSKNSALDAYITSHAIGPPVQTSLGPVYTTTFGGRSAQFLNEGNHWHVKY